MNSIRVSGFSGVKNLHHNSFKAGSTVPVAPAQKPDDSKKAKKGADLNKAVPIVTSAVALASLGVATYAIVRNPKDIKNLENKLDSVSKSLTKDIKAVRTETEKSVQNTNDSIKNVRDEINGVRDGLNHTIDETRNGIYNDINGVRNDVNDVRGIASRAGAVNMFTNHVNINGMEMDLAGVMHGYGEKEAALDKQLRSESARRILGAVKPVELPENAMIRVPTAEFNGFAKTGGLAAVPKELVANLGAVINNKQNVELVVDTPLYLGQVENSQFFNIVKNGEKYDYIRSKISEDGKTKNELMAKLNKIDTMHLPIYTDKGKTTERVEVYMSDEMRAAVDYNDTVAQFDEKTAAEIKKHMDEGQDYDTKLVTFRAPKVKGDAPTAEVKYHTVFYKNDKFRMDGPVQAGKVKNIYNDQTTQSGETERFVYFSKYFYENLLSNHETADKKLKADMIIGNDWHTGPISAMTRLLTPARKAMGLDPKVADKIQNTPIITIMHNFKLQGAVDHSQPKLLDVMFGEHAAKIAQNAWMPKDAEMPGHLMNGLFSGKALNPQTMAMSYSDNIVFVSRGNFEEASSVREKGGTNYVLASLRGRTWQYSDKENLINIGMANGIKPEDLGKTPTAKGITNGCDRVNNILTEKKARDLEKALELPKGTKLMSDEEALADPFKAHQHNKGVYLEKVVDEVRRAKQTNGKDNPLKIVNPEQTDLTGVDENTLVFGMAGRIVDQKGIDIYARGYEEYIKRGNFDKNNPPVCYLQGIGDQQYIDAFMAAKNRIREINPKAADRMIFAGVFSEAGRYDGCKMMSDISVMSSWDEPCGLVHKEIAYTSGAIPMVNCVGGLRDGLHEYKPGGDNSKANALFVKFVDKDTHSYEDALRQNANSWADAFETAQHWYENKESFGNGIKNSYLARHDWLRGKVQEYVEIGKQHGVIDSSVDSKYSLS